MSKHVYLDLFTECVKQRLEEYDLKGVPAALISAAFALCAETDPENLPISEYRDAGHLEMLLKEKIITPVCTFGKLSFTENMYSQFAETYAVIATDEMHTDTDYAKYMKDLQRRVTRRKDRPERGNVTALTEMLLNENKDLTDPAYVYSCMKELREGVYTLMSNKQNRLAEITEDAMKMRGFLLSRIFGQNRAVDSLAEGYMQYRLNEGKRRQPLFFLFAGPSGTGKSSLAKSVCEYLHMPYKRIDMSQYSDHQAQTALIGWSQTYKDAKEGVLTGYVKKNPRSVLVFDEVEKAHLNVKNLFLQVLEEGVLFDNYHEENVSFQDTILIFTTNAGSALYDAEERRPSLIPAETVISAMRSEKSSGDQTIPSALLSRFASGKVIMFDHVDAEAMLMIIEKRFQEYAESFKKSSGIEITWDELTAPSLLYSSPAGDARAISSLAESFLNDAVMNLIRTLQVRRETLQLSRIRIISEPGNDALFTPREDMRSLFFGVKKRMEQMPDGIDRAGSIEDALEKLSSGMYDMLLCDISYWHWNKDFHSRKQPLSRIKEETNGRKLMEKVLAEYPQIPLYIVETEDKCFDAADRMALLRMGVRDTLNLDDDQFARELQKIRRNLARERQVFSLQRSSQSVSFKQVEFIAEDGKEAEIRLTEYDVQRNIQAGDDDSILSSLSMPKETFNDVIGQESVKQEMQFFISYLKEPYRYRELIQTAPKGILMYGPAGTGKTMLARAFAHEAGLAFISTQGSRYSGYGGAARLHQVFNTARKYAPAVIFIDEIDALARRRTGNDAEQEAGLTALLTEMDGFSAFRSRPVFVIAATNYGIDGGQMSLDAAAVRRFDRAIFVDLPDRQDRLTVLKRETAKYPEIYALTETELDSIASRTAGRSFAWLRNALNAAVRMMIMRGETKLTDELFEEAIGVYADGEERPQNKEMILTTARHEAGHALIQYLSGSVPAYITITSRGNYGGYTQSEPDETKSGMTKQELEAKIMMFMAGRAAEIVYYGNEAGMNTGAYSDLVSATRYAEMIIVRYGMDEELGQAVFPGQSGAAYRPKISRMLHAALEADIQLITKYRTTMDALVEALMKKNHLNKAEMTEIFEGGKK